jgi:hypothetical protein
MEEAFLLLIFHLAHQMELLTAQIAHDHPDEVLIGNQTWVQQYRMERLVLHQLWNHLLYPRF